MVHIKVLTALKIKQNLKPGLYSDGLGLYLQVRSEHNKSWIFRYRANGKLRDMGLGPLHTVSLAEAREKAAACRSMRLNGLDPIDERRNKAQAEKAEAAQVVTFEQCAEAYIAEHRAGWKNGKHAEQWTATLQTYAYPTFKNIPVAAVDLELVLKVLQPMWKTKTETASRLRGRIERILDWARIKGYRAGENPARWRGHLEAIATHERFKSWRLQSRFIHMQQLHTAQRVKEVLNIVMPPDPFPPLLILPRLLWL